MKVESADARDMDKYTRKVPQDGPNDEDPSSDAISLEDAYATLLHDRTMKRVLLDILYSVIYFSVFVAMLFSHIPASNTLYELGYSVSSTLASSGGDTVTSDSTIKFANIQTTGDTFDWLSDTFIPSVFVTEDYNGDLLEKDKWGRVASFNKVLGAVIFTTQRAAIHPCQAEQYLVDLYPNCYDSNNVTNDMKLISFDRNATEAANLLSRLKTNGTWLDFSTQSLVITIVTYNGELQAYAVTELTLKFHQGGYVEPSSSTTPAIADPYKHKDIIALDVLVGICWFAAMVEYLLASLSRLREVRARISNPMNWASRYCGLRITRTQHEYVSVILFNLSIKYLVQFPVALFYLPWYLIVARMTEKTFRDNLARLVVTGKQFDANSDERNGLMAVTDSLQEVANWTVLLRAVAVVAVILLGLRILKSFHTHPHLGVLTRTIASALHQFRWVFVVFVIVILTFSVSGTVLFGDRVEGFSSLSKSLETCINMLFGSFDYATIQNVYSPASMLFYWAYMIIVSLVLLNMMLAIVVDAYADVSSEKNQVVKNTSTTRVLRNIAAELLQNPLSTSTTRALSTVTRDLFRNTFSRSERGRAGRHMLWNMLVHGRPTARIETTEDVLTQYQTLGINEVISRGKIKSHLLLTLLESLCKSQQGQINPGAINVVKPRLNLTARALQDWFPGAQLPDTVICETMNFIREGMGVRTEAKKPEAHSAVKQPKRQRKSQVARMPLEASSISNLSGLEPEDISLRRTSDSRHRPDEEAAEESEAGDRDDDVRSQITLMLTQMGEMQRKMDLLLSQTPLE